MSISMKVNRRNRLARREKTYPRRTVARKTAPVNVLQDWTWKKKYISKIIRRGQAQTSFIVLIFLA